MGNGNSKKADVGQVGRWDGGGAWWCEATLCAFNGALILDVVETAGTKDDGENCP